MSTTRAVTAGRQPRRYTELVDTMLDVIAGDGLDRLSVREVATRAGVSIGAVQYHFPSKDDMLIAAFEDIVARIRARVQHLRFGPDLRANLRAVLEQLLPLDQRRADEARIHLAFAARASVTPTLAAIQDRTLSQIHAELGAAIAQFRPDSPETPQRAADTVRALLALTDGLALHAASAPGLHDPDVLTRALASAIDALLAEPTLAAQS